MAVPRAWHIASRIAKKQQTDEHTIVVLVTALPLTKDPRLHERKDTIRARRCPLHKVESCEEHVANYRYAGESGDRRL